MSVVLGEQGLVTTMMAGAWGQHEEGVTTPTSHQSEEFVTPQHWSSCMSTVSTSFTFLRTQDHLLHIVPGLRDALVARLVVILQTIVHLSLDRVGEIRLAEK